MPPRPRFVRLLEWSALVLGSAAVCYALWPMRYPGGDQDEMILWAESRNWLFFSRSPGAILLYQSLFRVFAPLGVNGAQVIAASSAAAGGVYVAALLMLGRHPLFLAINLCAGTSFLFMGHLENYAWVNALLMLYYALARRHLERGAPLWPAGLVLALACPMHMLAVFHLPTLAWLMLGWDRARRHPRLRVAEPDAAIVLIAWITMAGLYVLGAATLQPMGVDVDAERLVRWTPNHGHPHFHFTFLDWRHGYLKAYFQLRAAPVGWPVLLAFLWRIRTRFHGLLAGAVGCGLLWTTAWNPDLEFRDWDLFASPGFAVNLLAGTLLVEWLRERQARRRPAS